MDVVIYDVDGVLVDWTKGFFHFMEENQGITPVTTEHLKWDMLDNFPGKSAADLAAFINAYHQSQLYHSIPLIPGAVQAVSAMRSLFPLAKHVAVSACGMHPFTLMARAAMLNEVFDLDEFHPVAPTASKQAVFGGLRHLYGGVGLVIDDSVGHVISAKRTGLKGILFDAPYNRGEDAAGLVRLGNWSGLREALANVN